MGDLVLHCLWLRKSSVSILHHLLQLLQQLLLLVHSRKLLVSHNCLQIEFWSDLVSSWHEMVEIDSLEEWLEIGSLGDLLLTHLLRHFSWVLVETSHHCVTISSVLNKIHILALVPSSEHLMITAFFPANLPVRRMTTRPYLRLS